MQLNINEDINIEANSNKVRVVVTFINNAQPTVAPALAGAAPNEAETNHDERQKQERQQRRMLREQQKEEREQRKKQRQQRKERRIVEQQSKRDAADGEEQQEDTVSKVVVNEQREEERYVDSTELSSSAVATALTKRRQGNKGKRWQVIERQNAEKQKVREQRKMQRQQARKERRLAKQRGNEKEGETKKQDEEEHAAGQDKNKDIPKVSSWERHTAPSSSTSSETDVENNNKEDRMEDALKRLEEQGFMRRRQNQRLLLKFDGDVEQVAAFLKERKEHRLQKQKRDSDCIKKNHRKKENVDKRRDQAAPMKP